MAAISQETRERIRAAWPEMLLALESGELVKDVLARAALTYGHLGPYLQTEPGARQSWEDAREASAHAMYDEALKVARTPVDKELAQSARLHVDTLKWAARIRNPRLYGDKAQLDVNVRTVDLTAIISAANARLAVSQANRMIDVTPSKLGDVRAHVRAEPALESAPLIPADLASLL